MPTCNEISNYWNTFACIIQPRMIIALIKAMIIIIIGRHLKTLLLIRVIIVFMATITELEIVVIKGY